MSLAGGGFFFVCEDFVGNVRLNSPELWKWGATARTTHLIQRPCYQRGSPCQDPAGNRTTWGPPDHRKETQTAVVWSCLPFIRSGQNHLARHNERGKKTRPTKEEVGRQHQGIDRPGVRQVSEGSGEQGKIEKTGLKIIVVPQRPSRLRDWWWWWRKPMLGFLTAANF